eukprot:COSAG02_NODE_297_length_25355_cov_78.632998_14_plen_721_part_00
MEIATAIQHGVPIVTVRVQGTFAYEFADAQAFLQNFQAELEQRNPGAGKLIEANGFSLAEVGAQLLAVVPNVISKDYTPAASGNVINAQIQDIVLAMEEVVSQPPPALVAVGGDEMHGATSRGHGSPKAPQISEPKPETQRLQQSPEPQPVAEELFQVLATGQIMTVMELFQAGINRTECRSLSEAAAEARQTLQSSLADAQAKADVLGRGLAVVAQAVTDLMARSASVDSVIEQEMAATKAMVVACLDQRTAELKADLSKERDGRRAALDAQHADLARQHAAQLQLCTQGAALAQQDDLAVVRLLADLQSTLSAEAVSEIAPQREPDIPYSLDDVPTAARTAVSVLSSIGAVGLPPPDLQGYSDPQPTYTVGTAISPNKPVGQLTIGHHGLTFDAPGLPSGLLLDATTGVVSGLPTVATEAGAAPAVIVTARNHGGITTAELRMTVRPRKTKTTVVEFKPTGAIVEWTVPGGVESAVIEAWGAQGGGSSRKNGKGGVGAHLRGTFALTGGEVLSLLVGQTPAPGRSSGGGGGGTFLVRKAGTAPLLVAGGGGGAGYESPAANGLDAALTEAGVRGADAGTQHKGASGGRDGAGGGGDGYYGGGNDCCGRSGGGLLSDGVPTKPGDSDTKCGVGRAFVNGGAGGTRGSSNAQHRGEGGFGGGGCGGNFGGGGGGGYSGGGGGAYNACGGGGGGSLNKGASPFAELHRAGGDGRVTITYMA